MNWEEVIGSAEIIYASSPDDIGFRTWNLKKTKCNVSFYEEFEITDIDQVFCSIVYSNGKSLEMTNFATILGFNVVDDFDIEPKRYTDCAELIVFKQLIQSAIDWGLMTFNENHYVLTALGEFALINKKKYRFYTGTKELIENVNIKPSDAKENLLFPFYSELGVYSEILNQEIISYKDIQIDEVFGIEETELIQRHKLQSKSPYFIYKSEKTQYFSFDSCQVDIRLLKLNSEYLPILFNNDIPSFKATSLLHSPDNSDQKEKKIEWGLYLKLIKDPTACLDYDTIIPFQDLLELDSLIQDQRLVWHDHKLFSFIAEVANADQWFLLSKNCPIDVLKLNLNKHVNHLDWTSLSLRVDDDFLVDNSIKYPWDYEIISGQENISIEVLKTLLLVPELKELEWDWDAVMPRLDFEFIKSHLDHVNFDLKELTRDSERASSLIVQFPTKNWDWAFISSDFDLYFILDNISSFSGYLDMIVTLNRAFSSDKHVNAYANSTHLKSVLITAKDNKLTNYIPNQEQYIWTDSLIDLLDNTGYLTWESGTYISGFECNPYLDWSYDLFNRYHPKIITSKGFDYLSSKISDSQIIKDFADFGWNWDVISANTQLINKPKFVLQFQERLNFQYVISQISGNTLETIFDEANVVGYLHKHTEQWSIITDKPSKEFILKHIDLDWDWNVLTRRFYSSIRIESLGNAKWIDKWDWKFLTRNLVFSDILAQLDLYPNRWDWSHITLTANKQFLLDNLTKYNQYWQWELLLNERLDAGDLDIDILKEIERSISNLDDKRKAKLWGILTRKFDFEVLSELISTNKTLFSWDYAYFYDLPEFNPLSYLQENREYIEWSSFSGSNSLNQSLLWDKKLFSYGVWIDRIMNLLKSNHNNWDFKALSKLDSINWNSSVLQIEKSNWDWEYLSEFSGCFQKNKRFSERFKEFDDYINFTAFSKRTDSLITEDLISNYIKEDWDWKILSNNSSVKISESFLVAHHEKPWDWYHLASRHDIVLHNDSLLNLSDKSWDWQAISNRTDIVFSEKLIFELSTKPLAWQLISKKKSFEPSARVLSLLKGEELDWQSISVNPHLSLDILWQYKDLLDWSGVTRNAIINLSDIDFLIKYQDYLDWDYISNSPEFNISEINLEEFKSKLNWYKVCRRPEFIISERLLASFAGFVDWSIVSASMDMQLTEALIEKYRCFWDWQILRRNPQVIANLNSTLNKYEKEFNCVNFLERFDNQPYIYHFTHLFNAVEIIKNRKILSRNKAKELGLLKYDAAGSVVERTSKAHPFARFYFRPQTPTQFYNECLGWDTELKTNYDKSYYSQASRLGLPKCPIPVFFRFDLKEVLMKMPNKCFHSTGNMQTNKSRIVKIADNPEMLQMTYLYDNISDAFGMAGGPFDYDPVIHKRIMQEIKEYSQQEFLVEDEFNFSSLDSFEIVCYNEDYEHILKNQIADDPITSKINSNGWNLFHRANRQLIINENESEISIYSEYRNSAHILLKGEGLSEIEIIDPYYIQKENSSEITAYPGIKFTKTQKPLEVYFVDTTHGNRHWLIYKT